MPTYFTFLGGGSATSSQSLAMKALERGLKKYFPSVATRVELSTSAKSIARIEDKTADVSVAAEYQLAEVVSGKADPFKKHNNIRMVGSYSNNSYMIFVTTGDSAINTVKDFKGKRISVGPAAGPTETFGEIILKAYGLDYKTIEAAGGVIYKTPNWAEAVEMLIAGQLDVVGLWTTHPEPTTLGLAKGRKGMKIIPMEEGIKKVLAEVPSLVPNTFPGGDYPGQQGPFNTFGNINRFFARADLSDDVIYNFLAAAYWGDAAEFRAVEPWAKLDQINIEVGREVAEVPWHPGAKKFWWELWKLRGLLK